MTGDEGSTVDRTVLVTGAARGIGAAVARHLAARGARVVALDRCADDPALDYSLATREQLDAVVRDCGNASVAVVADVADRDVLADRLDSALAGTAPPGVTDSPTGVFDAVVCAAGVVWGGTPLWETPPEVWTALNATNVTGVLNTAAVTLPAMTRAATQRGSAGEGPAADHLAQVTTEAGGLGRGRFVAVASAAAERGLARMGAYAASKAAVVSMVRSMAADLGDSPVTVNAVSPGSTDTDVLAASAAVYGLESPRDLAVHHTTGRLVTPDEVARAVVWLCSAEASAVTGSVLTVDGGMTAR